MIYSAIVYSDLLNTFKICVIHNGTNVEIASFLINGTMIYLFSKCYLDLVMRIFKPKL